MRRESVVEAAGIFVLPQVGIEIDRCALQVNNASEIKRLQWSRENVNMNSFMLNVFGGLDAAHFGEQMDNPCPQTVPWMEQSAQVPFCKSGIPSKPNTHIAQFRIFKYNSPRLQFI